MFGRNKQPQPVDNQIPYEVYETAQQPIDRRRRWLTLLAMALIAVTLLIVGGLAIRNALSDDDAAPANGTDNSSTQREQGQGSQPSGGGSQSSGNQLQPPQTLSQPPQQNAPLPNTGSDPEPSPQSGSSNNSTVRKPE